MDLSLSLESLERLAMPGNSWWLGIPMHRWFPDPDQNLVTRLSQVSASKTHWGDRLTFKNGFLFLQTVDGASRVATQTA